MVAITLAFRAAAQPLLRFFDDDPKVLALATGYVDVVAWSYLGLGTGVVLGNAIAGAGATRLTLITDLAVVFAFQLPASTAAVTLPGATLGRLWAAVAATYVVSGVTYLFVFRLAPWMKAAEKARQAAA